MKIQNSRFSVATGLANISRITRTVSLILISLAMIAVTINFHTAGAVLGEASVLPVYIFFFILMYMACLLVEYVSLWCERGNGFYRARVFVHCAALLLVTFEVGTFYSSGQDGYSHLSSNTMTQVLSHIVISPSDFHKNRLQGLVPQL